VRGQESRLALSVCDDLSGYIKTNQGQYFIEVKKGKKHMRTANMYTLSTRCLRPVRGPSVLVAGKEAGANVEMEAVKTGHTHRPKDGRDANYREQTLVF